MLYDHINTDMAALLQKPRCTKKSEGKKDVFTHFHRPDLWSVEKIRTAPTSKSPARNAMKSVSLSIMSLPFILFSLRGVPLLGDRPARPM